MLDIPEEDWDRAHEMVLKPVIRMAKLLAPVMEAQGGGSIVNITTFSAFEPSLTFPTSSVYRVGVSSFTKQYSDRYGPANIRMNCLLPGFTDSLDLPHKFAEMSALGRACPGRGTGQSGRVSAERTTAVISPANHCVWMVVLPGICEDPPMQEKLFINNAYGLPRASGEMLRRGGPVEQSGRCTRWPRAALQMID